MTDIFGRYQSQTTRGLAKIDSSKYPDTNKDFEANVRRLNSFVDYVAQYLQQMQKGVDQANQDPISQMRNIITDMGILLGGGELLYGINLGDLQYYLPALAALFGFDTGQPFPLNLFYAAEHFLLGYIVPLDSFAFVIEDLIDGWAAALGIDPDFIHSLHQLLEALQTFFTDFESLFNDLYSVFSIFGISTDGLGPFGDLWHSISQLLGGFNLKTLGDLTDPIFHALAPWVKTLAQFVTYLDDIVKSFSGGTTDVQGILNFASIFDPVTWTNSIGSFNPLTAISGVINSVFNSTAGIPGVNWLAGLIPGIDTTKIVSGTLIDAFIPGIGTLLNNLLAGFTNTTPGTGATHAQVLDTVNTYTGTTNNNIIQTQNVAYTIVSNASTSNSMYDCRYPIGDVTYPEFLNWKNDIVGLTDGPSTIATTGTTITDTGNVFTAQQETNLNAHTHNHDHTHTLSDVNDAFAQPFLWGISPNDSRGGYIGVRSTSPRDTIGFCGIKYTAGSVNNVFLEMFKENISGGLDRIFSVDVSADLTDDPDGTYIEKTLPSTSVQAGERYVVRVRNSDTGGNFIGVRALRVPSYMGANAFNTIGATATNRTTLTAAQAITAQGEDQRQCMWALIAYKNFTRPEQQNADNFDRALLGDTWLTKRTSGTGDLAIVGNKLAATANPSIQNGLYFNSLSTNESKAEVDISNIGAVSSASPLGPAMHMKDDFSQMVWLAVWNTGASIYSGSDSSLTLRDTISVSNNDGKWIIYYDESANTYYVMKNGVIVTGLEWNDSGHVIIHDQDHRHSGVRIVRGGFDSQAFIDNWADRDWVAP